MVLNIVQNPFQLVKLLRDKSNIEFDKRFCSFDIYDFSES